MARGDVEGDVTEGAGALESAATRRARNAAVPDAPMSAEALADAIAKAHIRAREDEGKVKEKPLPEIVRASVRCGYETKPRERADGSRQLITAPASITFAANETADGQPATVQHGKPVRLKRDAFRRYEADGKVIIAQ